MPKHISFPDRKQNFWQLGCIAGSALGLPGMIVGGLLAHQYGAGAALISVCTGNLILWLIGVGFISMSRSQNAIENVKNYLGKKTGIVAAMILTLSFLIWYSVQISGAAFILANFFEREFLLEIGVGLGLLIAILGMGGIVLIRKICVYSLPLLLLFCVLIIGFSDYKVEWTGAFSFSMSGIFTVMLAWLPGIVNLPTLFRHAENKIEAILGLSLMIVFHVLFQVFAILSGFSDLQVFSFGSAEIYKFLIVGYLIPSYLCINLINLYLGSAGIEMLLPKFRGKRTYFSVGIVGTIIFALVQIYSNRLDTFQMMNFLEIVAGSFMGSLAIVLSVNFIMKFFVKDHLIKQRTVWSNLFWIVGCLTTLVVQMNAPVGSDIAFVVGMSVVIFSFIILGFVGIAIRSWRKLKVFD